MPHLLPALMPEGVYTAPYLSESGHPVLIAVDGHGRRLREVVIESTEHAFRASRDLRDLIRRVA